MNPVRIDVLLHRLCLTRSRSEAKSACEAGAVSIGDSPAAASKIARVGDLIGVRFATRLLEIELLEMPGKGTSKKAAREMYRITRDEPITSG